MRHFLSTFHRALAALLIVTGVASATPITLATPGGLNPGDKFRFLVVTTGLITPTPTDINTYNTIVQADLADAIYNNVAVTWKAIGSTASKNARDNVGGFGSLVPVFTASSGTRLANDLTTNPGGLWGGGLSSPANETLSGASALYVWTGTLSDGTASNPLGSVGSVYTFGDTSSVSNWMYSNISSISTPRPMYGLSEELIVPSAVPEIDPAGMVSVMALVTGALGLLERRRLACLRS